MCGMVQDAQRGLEEASQAAQDKGQEVKRMEADVTRHKSVPSIPACLSASQFPIAYACRL